ncbi:hypothetical protein [Isobaculum melis]|nr:hypothetical protein [Isobaculum melis]
MKKYNYLWCFIPFFFLINSAMLVFAETPQEEIYSSKEEAVKAKTASLQSKPGTYLVFLRYHDDDQTIEENVYVTVFGEETTVKDPIAIDAHSIVVPKDSIEKLSLADWIQLTDARAWRTDTAEQISVTSVDTSKVSTELGTYPITFFTVNQVQTTIQVQVVLDKETQEIINSYHQNDTLGNFEELAPEEKISWLNFENALTVVLQFTFILLLFVPIIALLLQYGFTQKLVMQVIRLVIK